MCQLSHRPACLLYLNFVPNSVLCVNVVLCTENGMNEGIVWRLIILLLFHNVIESV